MLNLILKFLVQDTFLPKLLLHKLVLTFMNVSQTKLYVYDY